MLGYEAHELLKMTWVDITHPEDLALAEQMLQRFPAAKTWERRAAEQIVLEVVPRATEVRRIAGRVDHIPPKIPAADVDVHRAGGVGDDAADHDEHLQRDRERQADREQLAESRRDPRCGISHQVADRVGRFVEERLDDRLGHDFLR